MALRTPPSWLQYGSHTAENDRLTHQALYSSTGVIGNSLAVSQNGTPNMSVNIASGWCSILSSTANAGVYVGYNDASTNVVISTADATNPRVDLVIATVSDSVYSGSTNTIGFSVVAGVPSGSPSAPALPSNSIALAQVAVAAGATTIVTANITDRRIQAQSSAALSNVSAVHLSANGSAIGASGYPFGSTSRPVLTAGNNYQVDILLPFTKNTAGTVTWGFYISNATMSGVAAFSDSLNQSVSTTLAPGSATGSISFPASASYAAGSTYVMRMTANITVQSILASANAGQFGLGIIAISAGTVTPLAGAQMIVTNLGSANALGVVS